MTTRTATQITAQVAVEAIVNDAADYDLDTMKSVYEVAIREGVAKLYVSMLSEAIILRDPPVVPEVTGPVTGSYVEGRANGRHYSMTQIMASNAAFYDCHTVEVGAHVLEDTHETRDGFPMSVVQSMLGPVYYVKVDTNEYN